MSTVAKTEAPSVWTTIAWIGLACIATYAIFELAFGDEPKKA